MQVFDDHIFSKLRRGGVLVLILNFCIVMESMYVRGWHSRVGKISDYQQEGPGFNSRPGRVLNFGQPSFAPPSVDRDVKPLVYS